MSRGEPFAPFFQRLIDDPAAALQALRTDPDRFAAELIAEEQGRLAADGVIPAYDALGVMLFDAAGARVPLAGPNWLPSAPTFDALPADAIGDGGLLSIRRPDLPPLHALWAPACEVDGWKLPPSARGAIASHPGGRAVLVAGGAVGEEPLDAACHAFGLTDLERRVVVAVVRTGTARAAATALGLSYPSVREVLPRAARRMGVPNLPAIVRAVVAAAFGVLPDEAQASTVLADMLPLTERQATIAALVSSGLSRDEVARAVRVSLSVVKKELEQIFAALGVASAAELARTVVEVRALRLIARSTDSALGFYDPNSEPTRLTPRDGDAGGSIAWSDYGPRSGRPILVVHSNWCCRSVPRPFVAAMHARGFRPIAIDRPGFGATSLGASNVADPFSQAVADTLTVLDIVGVARVPVVARCGAQFVVALKAAAPERVGPVVLVSPTPPTTADGQRRGIVGVVKESFYRSPALIEFFFRIISAQMSLARVETLHRAILAGCAVDERLCDDPAFLRERLRAIRPLSTGAMAGAVFEEHVISRGRYPLPTIDARDWAIVVGASDIHNSVAEVRDYWGRVVPRARMVEVAEGGRFMLNSHAALVADLIAGLMAPDQSRPKNTVPTG